MKTLDKDTQLIERASALAGSQNKLAKLLGMDSPNLTQMKHGKRPMNWRIRGKLRAFTGENPAHAFIAAIVDELAQSDDETEKEATHQLKAALTRLGPIQTRRHAPQARAG